MQHKRMILWTAGAFVAVWAVAGAVVLYAQAIEVTPEKVIAYVEATSLDELDPDRRQAWIDGLASRVNRLDFDQRRQRDLERTVRQSFVEMTPDERRRYLEMTLPQGFKEMFDTINNMSREERQRLVDRALDDIRRAEASGEPDRLDEEIDPDMVQQVVDEGMRQYLSEASAEAKLDLQPLIDAMQGRMRRIGR